MYGFIPEHWTWQRVVLYLVAAVVGKAIWDFLKWGFKTWRENRKWR
jgi:hypothetical protein